MVRCFFILPVYWELPPTPVLRMLVQVHLIVHQPFAATIRGLYEVDVRTVPTCTSKSQDGFQARVIAMSEFGKRRQHVKLALRSAITTTSPCGKQPSPTSWQPSAHHRIRR